MPGLGVNGRSGVPRRGAIIQPGRNAEASLPNMTFEMRRWRLKMSHHTGPGVRSAFRGRRGDNTDHQRDVALPRPQDRRRPGEAPMANGGLSSPIYLQNNFN